MSLNQTYTDLKQFRHELQDLAVNCEQNWNDVIAAMNHQAAEWKRLIEGVKSLKANQLAIIDAKLIQLDLILDPPAPEATDEGRPGDGRT